MENKLSDPNNWLELYGDALFAYAFVRLKNYESAEEVVQETFLAALRAKNTFSGLSSEKTWFFGILKNKIADVYRKRERQKEHIVTEDFLQDYFNAKGHWKRHISDWQSDPRKLLEKKEFWDIFEKCMEHLSKDMSEAIQLKMLEKLSSEEICNVLQISDTNLWVRLHRGRAKIRECLEKCWFSKNT